MFWAQLNVWTSNNNFNLIDINSSINSIQFILYSPKSQICLRGLYNLYTDNIPVPGPHRGSGKTPKTEKTLTTKKRRKETFRRATEEDPSPRMDRSNRCYVYRMNNVTERQQTKWIWQKWWIMIHWHGPWSRPSQSMKQEEEARRGVGGGISRAMAGGRATEAGGRPTRQV